MNLAIFGIGFLILFALGYRYYGGYVARQVGLDNNFKTPAHLHRDDRDFVPTNRAYLFAQHFSAISAAGPIAGPIMACLMWGWLPCLLWIAFGVVFIGAVHDFLSLAASVKHGAVSIAQIAKEHLGKNAGMAIMIFIWLALIYVIVAFTDITAASFVGKTEELLGAEILFNPGGAVAMAASLYLAVSLVMGVVERIWKPKLWITTAIFVPLVFFCVWLGTKFSTVLILETKHWCMLILVYCFLASLTPVWLLLQPRGYLGGFILYTVLSVGIIGVLFGGYEIKQEAVKSWDSLEITGALFPFLFVTIACGACSGFHGLVCSGTTSKQIDRECDMQSIGYGAMLCEAIVALIALVTVMIWSPQEIVGLKPGTIYGKGIGEFLTIIFGKEYLNLAITFGAMAFSTFVFDTLDVSTRLGRYLVQELFSWHSKTSAVVCTFITVAIPCLFVILADQGSYLSFWTLFGASNQLLAALTLLAITVWLYRARRRIAFTLMPMLFILIVTGFALGDLAIDNLRRIDGFGIHLINGLVALSLIGLAVFLIITAAIKVRSEWKAHRALEARAEEVV